MGVKRVGHTRSPTIQRPFLLQPRSRCCVRPPLIPGFLDPSIPRSFAFGSLGCESISRLEHITGRNEESYNKGLMKPRHHQTCSYLVETGRSSKTRVHGSNHPSISSEVQTWTKFSMAHRRLLTVLPLSSKSPWRIGYGTCGRGVAMP